MKATHKDTGIQFHAIIQHPVFLNKQLVMLASQQPLGTFGKKNKVQCIFTVPQAAASSKIKTKQGSGMHRNIWKCVGHTHNTAN